MMIPNYNLAAPFLFFAIILAMSLLNLAQKFVAIRDNTINHSEALIIPLLFIATFAVLYFVTQCARNARDIQVCDSHFSIV